MNLQFLGGAMEIGGSCIYLQAAGKRILLDCGIRQSASVDPLPDFAAIQAHGGLDAIIISHAHMDHIGTLPIISKAYPDVKIYMTMMTADLTRVLLYDSLKIMNGREDEIPHYTEQDVLAMLNRIHPVRYQQPLAIFTDFILTLYPAGHIAGASCVYLTTEEGSLFYSGDFSSFAQRTIEGLRIPKLRPDVVIVETTYGTRLHANRQVEERRLVNLVAECIKNGQKILIPAFALGRAQEVLLILRAAIQNQEIPAVPVYVDGMVRDINTMYTRNSSFLKNALARRIVNGGEPFYTREIQPVSPNQNRDDLLKGKDPVIIVSSSGMLTGGPSMQYARQLVSSENACIIITGYQDEESPGRQLLDLLDSTASDRKLTLGQNTYPVRCRIEQVGLSAHSDRGEIEALLDRLSARHLFLVHGNADVIRQLGMELAAQDFRRQVILPECGQEYPVILHAKRKQLSTLPPFTLQKKEEFTAESAKLLWDYWQQHYAGKRFSISQIAYIWYGRQAEESDLQAMQDVLLKSPYFSQNQRQLYLFEANSQADVEAALAPKELTVQELQIRAEAIFSGFPFRKLGYHTSSRKVVLFFDYPDSIDQEAFLAQANKFQQETGWTAEFSPSMNHNEAGNLLHTLFSDRLLKISYYQDQRCYSVTLSRTSDEDAAAAENFLSATGWTLLCNGISFSAPSGDAAENGRGAANASFSPSVPHKMEFIPLSWQDSTSQAASAAPEEPLEQNLAFTCIDMEFDQLPCTLEKKSLKQDDRGRYIELAFISPAIGQRFSADIQRTADQIGWRIRIADRINQIALAQTAQSLCSKHGIVLAKNPSYLPAKKSIALKAGGFIPPGACEAVQKEFDELTGCSCEITII